MKSYGEFIREHRIKSGYSSMRKLAEKSGISAATLSRIESEIQRPQYETLKQLSPLLTSTNLAELLASAGYLDGIEENDKTVVMDFFDTHQSLDDEIKLTLKHIFICGERAIEEAKTVILEVFNNELNYNDIGNDFEKILASINYQDPSHDLKSDLLAKLKQILGTEKNSDSFKNEREFLRDIDLSADDITKKYVISVDGQPLTSKDLARLVGIIRLDRQLD